MRWIKTSAVCLQSEDGQWVIAKFMVRGAWVYQLCRLGKPSESVLIAATADECKEAARDHRPA